MTDCITILRAAGQANELVAACLQADATIHAARIQATAARQAGTMGLFAGLGAVLAAAAAYWSARIQIRLVEQQHVSKTLSYKSHILSLVKRAIQELSSTQSCLHAKYLYRLNSADKSSFTLSNCKILAQEISTENFERHALLGGDVYSIFASLRNQIETTNWSFGELLSNIVEVTSPTLSERMKSTENYAAMIVIPDFEKTQVLLERLTHTLETGIINSSRLSALARFLPLRRC